MKKYLCRIGLIRSMLKYVNLFVAVFLPLLGFPLIDPMTLPSPSGKNKTFFRYFVDRQLKFPSNDHVADKRDQWHSW